MRCSRLLPITALLVLALFDGHAQPATRSETGQPLIMNYWTHLQSILEDNERQRETQTMRPDGKVLKRVNYPFDAVMHLKPAHLLRAAKEGIDFARTEGWGLAPDAAARQAYRNVGIALEYYPLLAVSESDFMPLLHTMGRREDDPILRVYLFNHVLPGMELPSLFSRYMQEEFQKLDVVEARPYLFEPATFPLEEPEPQAAAIRALFAHDLAWFSRQLALMPEFEAYARQVDTPIGPALLLREDAPEPTGDVGSLMIELIKSIGQVAGHLAEILRPESGRPEALQGVAREHLGLILENFPIPNADAVRAALDPENQQALDGGEDAPESSTAPEVEVTGDVSDAGTISESEDTDP
jgi:hypothetical protein